MAISLADFPAPHIPPKLPLDKLTNSLFTMAIPILKSSIMTLLRLITTYQPSNMVIYL